MQDVYPFASENVKVKYPIDREILQRNYKERVWNSQPESVPQRSGATGVWAMHEKEQYLPDRKAFDDCGAVYVYSRQQEVLTDTGTVINPRTWDTLESARL